MRGSAFGRASRTRPPAVRHLLQFNDVAFGIMDIDRQTCATRSITHRGITEHLDPALLQINHCSVQIARLDTEAEVIDVSARLAARVRRGYKIDDTRAGPQLNQADLIDAPLFMQPEHVRVKGEHPRLIATAQDDVIEFRDAEGYLHRLVDFQISIRSARNVWGNYSAVVRQGEPGTESMAERTPC